MAVRRGALPDNIGVAGTTRNFPSEAAKLQIVRLLVYKKLKAGQHPGYVDHFAVAAEGEGAPSWIREAEQRAAIAVKASVARPGTGRGGGRGRGQGNRGGTSASN